MVWLLIAISISVIVILAGRAHSRYLDRLEAKLGVVVQIQLLGVSPDIVKQIETAAVLAPETSQQIPIDSFSGILVVNQTSVRPQEPDNQSIDCEIRRISDEGEWLETYVLREVAVAVSGVDTIAIRDKERRRKRESALAHFGFNAATR